MMTNFHKPHKYKTSCKYIRCFSSCYRDSKTNRSRRTWGECNGAFLQISVLNMLKKSANKIMPAPCNVTMDVNIPSITD